MLAQFLLFASLMLSVYVSRNFYKLKIRIYTRIFFVLIVGFSGFTIAFPQIAQGLAEIVGVGRGADLVFYLAAMSQIGLIGILISKFREVDVMNARLVREITLLERKIGDYK